jgi:hypothetical protein
MANAKKGDRKRYIKTSMGFTDQALHVLKCALLSRNLQSPRTYGEDFEN